MNSTAKRLEQTVNDIVSTEAADLSGRPQQAGAVLEEYAATPGSLITILQKAQDIYGYLPLVGNEAYRQKTGVKPASVYGVATFYTQFRLKPVANTYSCCARAPHAM